MLHSGNSRQAAVPIVREFCSRSSVHLVYFRIIPLAKLLGFATEELAIRVGETLGGLMNATLGNAVELIISVRIAPLWGISWLTPSSR